MLQVVDYGQNNPEYDYTMNNDNLESVNEECDLGVTFSTDLKFKKINKANSMLSLVKRTFEYLDKHSFLRL